MKKYNIIKLYNEPYEYLIIATTYESPIIYIEEIKKEITCKKMLFDLMLINGNKSNRFIGSDMKACEKFDPSTFFIANDVTDSIKEISYRFFSENKALVENSVLPNALKFLISKCH